MTTTTEQQRPRVTKRQMPAAWQKQWRLDRALGRPRQVPADRARKHVEDLLAAGWTLRAIAEQSGLSASTLENLRRRNDLVRVGTQRAILALQPRAIFGRANGAGFVPAVGARRRIRALMAMGWTHAEMKRQSGILTSVALNQRGDFLAKATHDAIADMYEALCMTPGPSQRTRARAVTAGYAPPLAWDDIDDPAEKPNYGTSTGHEAPLDDWLHLVRLGVSVDHATRQCGTTHHALERAAYRHGRTDVLRCLGINHETSNQEVNAA